MVVNKDKKGKKNIFKHKIFLIGQDNFFLKYKWGNFYGYS